MPGPQAGVARGTPGRARTHPLDAAPPPRRGARMVAPRPRLSLPHGHAWPTPPTAWLPTWSAWREQLRARQFEFAPPRASWTEWASAAPQRWRSDAPNQNRTRKSSNPSEAAPAPKVAPAEGSRTIAVHTGTGTAHPQAGSMRLFFHLRKVTRPTQPGRRQTAHSIPTRGILPANGNTAAGLPRAPARRPCTWRGSQMNAAAACPPRGPSRADTDATGGRGDRTGRIPRERLAEQHSR